jgi:hypothetical protein
MTKTDKVKCPSCGGEVEVPLEVAARVMGAKGGRARGPGKGRELSSEMARKLVRAKYRKRHEGDLTVGMEL